jgi:Phosphoenolpyruvate phosphomutase
MIHQSRGQRTRTYPGSAGVGQKLQVHLVINARTDAYWRRSSSPEESLSDTLERGRAYLGAGADCILVPGLSSVEHIRSVVEHLRAPVNILGGAGVPSIPELARLGVKRVSLGSGPMRDAMGGAPRNLRGDGDGRNLQCAHAKCDLKCRDERLLRFLRSLAEGEKPARNFPARWRKQLTSYFSGKRSGSLRHLPPPAHTHISRRYLFLK